MLEETAPPDPLRDLAAAAGDDDPERWWEDVIEHRGDGAPAFDAVAEAMHAARVGYVATGAELQREAHMRRAIRTARRDGFETIVVVCGAWHVPALDLDSEPADGTPVPDRVGRCRHAARTGQDEGRGRPGCRGPISG